MCGIAGIVVGEDSGSAEQVSLRIMIENMLDASAYRGPDAADVFLDQQTFALGHSRLSIIDLNEASNQPMRYLNLVISFNGEIYNYLELKAELVTAGYKFITESDTEVLLKAYHFWGERCLQKLNGMFAFAVYHCDSGDIFLARDRLGEKPLYYFKHGKTFIFASEIKQILATGKVARLLNEESIVDYLAMQYSLSDKTFFLNILKLMPGHFLKYSAGLIRIEKYWDADLYAREEDFDGAMHGEKLKSAIETSVKLRLRSDVSICGYLSGGVDSNVVCQLASNVSENQFRTFTFGSNSEVDESDRARRCSEIYGTEHYCITMPDADFMPLWRYVTHVMDEPAVGYSLVPQYLMSKAVQKHSTVVLGGQGGDELFFGYGWHSILLIRQLNPVKNLKLWTSLLQNYFSGGFKSKIRNLYTLVTLQGATTEQRYFNLWKKNGCFELLKTEHQKELKARFFSAIN